MVHQVCVTCMYRGLSVKTNKRKNTAQHTKIESAFVLRLFLRVCTGRQNPKTPKLIPIADDAITQGGIGGLVSMVSICGIFTLLLPSRILCEVHSL